MRLKTLCATINAKFCTVAQCVGLICHAPLVDTLAVHAVALEIVHRADRPVDRNFVKVGAAQTRDLRIGVREQPALKQWVVGEIDTGYHVSGVEGHLLGFCKKIVGVAVQHHFSDQLHRHHGLGNQLGWVQNVKAIF